MQFVKFPAPLDSRPRPACGKIPSMYLNLEKLESLDEPLMMLAAAVLWRAVLDVQEFGASDAREFFNSAWYETIIGALGLDSHDILNRVSALRPREFRCYPRNESP